MQALMRFSGVPAQPVAVPGPIAAIAGGQRIQPVWVNEVGGLTFRLGQGEDARFAKWAPRGVALDLDGEAARLRWAAPLTPVPRVLDRGAGDEGAWLVTAALPGTNAVSPRWKGVPGTAVRAIGAGLRALHDALPAAACPFSWSVDDRLARVRHGGRPAPDLPPAPPIDELVVCHGDPCAPNTLIGDDGTWTGHVDMGALGVADRWADLAVASWSLEWNYGPGWDAALLEAYGVAPDPERTAFYRALWDAT